MTAMDHAAPTPDAATPPTGAFVPDDTSGRAAREHLRHQHDYDMGPDGHLPTPHGPIHVRLHHGGPSVLFAVDVPAAAGRPTRLVAICATAADVAAHRIDPARLAAVIALAPQEVAHVLSEQSGRAGAELSDLLTAIPSAFTDR